MTQLEFAKQDKWTKEMEEVYKKESISKETLIKRIKDGEIVIPKNINHKFDACGIGKGLTTKINANIGTSPDCQNIEYEIEKLKIAVKFGATAVMDLSTGGDLDKIRNIIIKESPISVGTVPMYEIAAQTIRKYNDTTKFDKNLVFDVIEKQCEQGVDFITVHCGVNKQILEKLKNNPRKLNIVSRGGAILAEWIVKNNKENPLFEYYDRLLEIAYKYDVTLSLGDGLRPGCLADASDAAQIQELIVLGELTKKAQEKNVQVMIEGPGHMPLNQIKSNMEMQKLLCHNAPFYVLGPLTTDVAPGYDHITSAIGGAIAATYGADFLCYVTPAEHLRLPAIDDVKQGVIASKIAAHSADIAKGIPNAIKIDNLMADARLNLNWKKQSEYAIDSELVNDARKNDTPADEDVCTMCSEFCAIKKSKNALL